MLNEILKKINLLTIEPKVLGIKNIKLQNNKFTSKMY